MYRHGTKLSHVQCHPDNLLPGRSRIRHIRAAGLVDEVEAKIAAICGDRPRPTYEGDLPEGHDGLGLLLLGVSGDRVLDPDTYARIRAETLRKVRGTVQADILKEDQAQNTCIFSTEFALKMMGDVQEFFVDNEVRNFYSVSVSVPCLPRRMLTWIPYWPWPPW